MRLELTNGTARQSWFPGIREARSVCHVHEGLAPGGGSILLIGRDDGCLEFVPERHPEWTQQMPAQRSARTGRIHLDAWWARHRDRPIVTIEEVVECAPDAPGQYAMGVTAVAALARPGTPDTLDLLVATRYPWLYVLEARAGTLRFIRRVPLPGWIDWIFAPRHPSGPIICLSRSGDLVRFSHEALLREGVPTSTALQILPTAAIWFGETTQPAAAGHGSDRTDDGLLIGTSTGLFLVRDVASDEPTLQAVPVTRAGVLSLGAAAVRDGDGAHDYVTLGLGDGRLRVVTADLIRGRMAGAKQRASTQSFSIDLGAAVLAEQALQPEGCPAEQAYVLAVLRDHSVRLFRVTSERTQRDLVVRRWDSYLDRLAAPARAHDTAFELEVASAGPPQCIEPTHWAYALVDIVLPRACMRGAELSDPDRAAISRWIAELACGLIASADRLALRRMSGSLHALAGGDTRQVQRLSAAIIQAIVAHRDPDAMDFVESHLRELGALAGACADRDRPLLVFWMRFVRKYIVRGPVFAAKRLKLIELVEQNFQARKHLDAMIYQARLHRQGYDLRWEAHLDNNIAAVHFACCSGCAIVVAITSSGGLVALDRATGDRLAIMCSGRRCDALAPFEQHREVRTLASAVIEDHGVTRVVISGDGARLPSPGLAVVDLSADPRDPTILFASVSYPSCEAQTRVHAIQPMPGHSSTFVVGLDTHEYPVGRLHHGKAWMLERAVRGGSKAPFEVERPQLAPGKVPTRAVSVAQTDVQGTQLLVATGSDDGCVLAFRVKPGEPASSWKPTEWDRVTDSIRCIVLGRHDPDGTLGSLPPGAQSLFSCYLGTTAGDTLALSILAARVRLDGPLQPFGPYFAQPLWRETHEAPMLAAQLWQTPLFRVAPEFPDRVLVLITEGGRMCIYHHAGHHAGNRSHGVSAQNNYYFRGLRVDRIALPERVSALALADGEPDFVSATLDGRVYLARLAYPRGSEGRSDPETRPQPRPGDPCDASGAAEPLLASETWARLHQLFTASQIDEPFELPQDERAMRKLELCELIRLDDGVLSTYALRERLTYHEPWDQLDASQLRAKACALLRGLRPDDREDAERIKVILKSLCGRFLSRNPEQLRDEILGQPRLAPAWREAIAAVCYVVHDYILGHLTHATHGSARLAIVAIKELLRVPTLHAMAGPDENGDAVRNTVGIALAACLRHDDRLVRTEALRTVSVMLRNVGVMVRDRPRRLRDRLLMALFPDGLASLAWLLDPIIEGLLRSPGFSARTVLVSGAWYRVSAIAQLFWIFPDRTLTLCDHLLGCGLPVDVLALCVQTMRGDLMQETRHMIERWFLIRAVDPDRDRDQFIADYQSHGEPPQPPEPASAAPWHTIDDATMVRRLCHLLHQLAQMWGVKDPEQLRALAARTRRSQRSASPPTPWADPGEPPLASLERVVEQLAAIAHSLEEAGRQEAALHVLRELHRPDSAARARLARPIQTVVSAIAEHWIDLCEPRLPQPGMKLGRFMLGRLIGEGGFGKVFEIDSPPEDRGTRVVKVLKRFTREAREQFLEGARFNQSLSNHPHVAQVVEILEPESWRPAYVMRRYGHDLEHYLSRDRRAYVSAWAADALQHVGEALQDAHQAGYCHGDVKPSNILVDPDHKTMRAQFYLADFDLAPDDSGYRSPHLVPLWLSQKCQSHDPKQVRQWLDLASLWFIGYRMLTGESASSDAKSFASCTDRLAQLAIEDRLGPTGARLIATMRRVLELPEPIGIDDLLRWLKNGPPPNRRRPTRILFLTASPGDLPPIGQVETEVKAIVDHFSSRPDVQLITDAAVRIEDLVRLLRLHSPDILHFSGHGSTRGIMLHDDNGQHRLVPGAALARCLDGRGVRLVVMNACFSKHQCVAILPMVGAVVGTTDVVNDEAARRFSVMFYQQVFAGSTLKAAFTDARSTVDLRGLPDVFHADGALEQVLAGPRP
ncbi:MAG TPA: CHAT domain-containing protein [Kofleriaceae bacterium]|nr:CHAT domain-containing protein [Kofleriaceae bacterium]